MARLSSDNDVIQEVIELYLVRYFDNIEMAGTVKHEKRDNLNYFSIDLNEVDLGENLSKLQGDLNKYLIDWAKANAVSFSDYLSVATLTIEYLLPEKDGSIQNQSKIIRLFYPPAFYFRKARNVKGKKRHPITIWFLNIWYSVIWRNIILVVIPTVFFLMLSISKNKYDSSFATRIAKSFEYVNIASGIIASFLLGYLINKVLTIRQDKLKRTGEIKNLSNKFTYFRNICYNLLTDYNYWNTQKTLKPSFEHAHSIKQEITFEEYFYPDYNDSKAYAKYRGLKNDDLYQDVVLLVLELFMLSGNDFLHSGLTFTEYPGNYIYTLSEMERFSLFADANQIEYCCSKKVFPETFPDTYGIGKILEDMERIDPQYKAEYLTKSALAKLSLDFQYQIIPRLYRLTKIVEAELPLTIRYFQVVFTLVLAFGIIVPSLLYIFVKPAIYAFISVFIVIAVISHILLSLPAILNTENTLNPEEDYF